MDLKDQLQNLFPEHEPEPDTDSNQDTSQPKFWLQDAPLICKYEKRRGKPVTIIEGYTGADRDFKILSSELKGFLSVGGSVKNERIILQGDDRDRIMEWLKEQGFEVKRVGG